MLSAESTGARSGHGSGQLGIRHQDSDETGDRDDIRVGYGGREELPLRPTARRFTRPTLGDGTISVIDSATLIVTATIPTGSAPFYAIFRRERGDLKRFRSDASRNSSVSYEHSCNRPNLCAGLSSWARFEKQEIAIRTDPCPLRLRAVKIAG